MPSLIDLTKRNPFGRLTAIEFSHFKTSASGSRQYFWKCVCECGKHVTVDGCCLRRLSTVSCGCYGRERATKHGGQSKGSATIGEYNVWLAMKQRCLNPNSLCFNDYGGRGITICDEWKNSFAAFFEHIGPRPSKTHTIERIKNHLGYQPGNVRWATRAEQNENTRQTRLLTLGDVTLSIGKWARRIGMTRSAIRGRLKRGMTVEQALTVPHKKNQFR